MNKFDSRNQNDIRRGPDWIADRASDALGILWELGTDDRNANLDRKVRILQFIVELGYGKPKTMEAVPDSWTDEGGVILMPGVLPEDPDI